MKQLMKLLQVRKLQLTHKLYDLFRKSKRARYATFAIFSCLLAVFGMLTFNDPKAFATTAGPNSPTAATGTTANGGTVAWTTPTNAETSNSTYTTAAFTAAATSDALEVTSYGFSIPTTATVNGITVSVQRLVNTTSSKADVTDSKVQLIVGGTITGSNLATATAWTTTKTSVTYGSSTTLWGLTPTPAQINATNFGVDIQAQDVKLSGSGAALTAEVDYVSVTVDYTVPASFTQGSYQFFQNQDGTAPSGTSSWTTATAPTWPGRTGFGTAYFNNEYWVMGGLSSSVYLNDVWCSSNGTTWSDSTCGTSGAGSFTARKNFQTLVFNNELWVIGGQNSSGTYLNDVWCSSNGTTWSDSTCGTSSAPFAGRSSFGAVVLGNAMYVFGGQGNSGYGADVWESSDGATWTNLTSTAAWTAREGFSALAFNNKLWVIGGYNGSSYLNDVWCSSDGVNWSDTACGTTGISGVTGRVNAGAAVFGNEMWLMGGANSSGTSIQDVWYSTNGSSWTQATASIPWSARQGMGVVTGNGNMYVLSGNTTGTTDPADAYYLSTSAVTTGSSLAAANTTATVPGDGTPFRLRQEIEVSGSAASASGQSFELQYALLPSGTCSGLSSTAYANVTDTTPVAYYANQVDTAGQSISYRSGTDPVDAGYTPVAQEYLEQETSTFTNPTAIPISSEGLYDFALTTHNATAGQNYCLQIVSSTGTALNGGYNNYPEVTIPSATTNQASYRFYKNQDATASVGSWTQGGSGGTNYTSALNRTNGGALSYNGSMYIFGGDNGSTTFYNDVYSSTDGSNWTSKLANCSSSCSQFSQRDYFGSVVFNGAMYVLGGDNSSNVSLSDVWCSTNGSTWQDNGVGSGGCGTTGGFGSFSARAQMAAVVFNNQIYVIGGWSNSSGDLGDVWSTSDGSTWTELTTSVPWGVRQGMQAVAYDGKIYVFGGYSSPLGQYFNDVWSSPDGINWTKVTGNAPWDARSGFSVTVQDNKMWVVGGYDGKTLGYVNDAWSSTDGANWGEVQSTAAWSTRQDFGLINYNNELWVLGGWDAAIQPNDYYINTGAIDVGTPYANLNTPLDMTKFDANNLNMLASPGAFRLRLAINVGASQKAASGLSLRLQYAEMAGGSCTATQSSGTWADVTTSTPIQFYTGNTHASNGAPLIPDTNDPTDGSNAMVYETFNDANAFTNTQIPVDAGQDGIWDFSLAVASTVPHTSYCLRAITDNSGSDGPVLSSYTSFPEVDMGPTMTQLLRGREWWNSSDVREYKDL